jgi:hypothetical protein
MSELSVGTLSGLAANSYVIDVASGSRLTQPGMLVAVKDAIFTGTQTASVVTGGNVAVTDLSITHEVADPANKLIISAFLGAAGTSTGFGNVGLAVHDGTGLIAVGASPGSRVPVTSGGFVAGSEPFSAAFIVTMPSVTFAHIPGSGSKTYTVRAVNIRSQSETLYINRSEDDNDNEDRVRAVSSLVIQEVAV